MISLIEKDRITKKADRLGLSAEAVGLLERWLTRAVTEPAEVRRMIERDPMEFMRVRRFGLATKIELVRWSGALMDCPTCAKRVN